MCASCALRVFAFICSTPIIFRQPPLSAVSNIFLLPLDKMVWYCYAALILCVIFIMGIQMGHPLLEAQITLFDVVSFVFGAACQQGTHLFIPSLSGRFVLITTFVATLALFTSYSASIVALLQSPSESIHTLDDLLASRLTLAVKDSNTTRRFFSSESKTVLRRLYNEKIQPMGTNAWITDEYIGIERVRSELFAFLIEAPLAYNAISHTYTELEKCRLSEIRVFASPMNTITVARNSGYKQLIKQRFVVAAAPFFSCVYFYFDSKYHQLIYIHSPNSPRLLWMREVGLIYRTRVKWLPKKPACEGDGRDFTIVGLREIYPLIYVYLFGSIISMLIFCVEICSIRCGPLLKQSKQYARKQTILLNNWKWCNWFWLFHNWIVFFCFTSFHFISFICFYLHVSLDLHCWHLPQMLVLCCCSTKKNTHFIYSILHMTLSIECYEMHFYVLFTE